MQTSLDFAKQFDAFLTSAVGLEFLIAACDGHLAKAHDDWRQFLEPHFREQRSWLFTWWKRCRLQPPAQHGIVDALIDLQAAGLPRRPGGSL